MTILNTFANQSGQIPLSQLDSNFATPITIGTTPIILGDIATTITGLTLAGANLGTPTGNLANCIFPTLNQNTTGTASNVTGVVAVGNGGTGLTSLTSGYIPYGNGTGALSSSANLFFDGTNLGIGTSSPATLLHLGQGQSVIRFGATSNGYDIGRDNSSGNYIQNATQAAPYNQFIWQQGGTERMRIDSSGNVGIGTSSPACKLQVTVAPASGSDNGMRVTDGTRIIQTSITGSAYSYIGVGASETMLYSAGNPLNIVSDGHPIKFITGNTATERIRIDDSGNLLVGTTSGTYKITCNGQPGANGYTAWTNYSDQRLKENITDFKGGLKEVLNLSPKSFNYNKLSGYDEDTRARTVSGFIAQELELVCPEMVGTTEINGVEYLDTNTSNLNLLLIKAIQELKAIIDTQQEQINSLLGK